MKRDAGCEMRDTGCGMRDARWTNFLGGIVVVCGVGLGVAWAILPANIRNNDPLRNALYKTESFQGRESHVPLPPAEARQNLLSLAQSQPQNAAIYRELSGFDVQLLDFAAAETHLRQFLQLTANKDEGYEALEEYYHSRLQFDQELKTILEHAKAADRSDNDVSQNTGAYAIYHRALKQIEKYGLTTDRATIYQSIVDAYPAEEKAYLEYIAYVKDTSMQNATAMLERMKKQFPSDVTTTLTAEASLLPADRAFDLLDRSYKPEWEMSLVKLLDQNAVQSGRKADYLNSLKDRLRKNALDFDAVTRAFYSYHLAGSAAEAQQILNDFRLLKEQNVREGKTQWNADELFVMARFSHLLLNFDDEARYDYSLYTLLQTHKSTSGVTADDALYGLFEVLLSADQRGIQIGAGNIDYYKDIAVSDSNPGILNGILSLLFNSESPQAEWLDLQPRVIGYYNRAQALRLISITQKNYPNSPHLPAMYRDGLKIYEKYGMDKLIVQAGEQFFKTYPQSTEVLDVGIAVTDAYSRMEDHENEWKTYEFLLPIAAAMGKGHQQNPTAVKNDDTDANSSGEEEYNNDEDSGNDEETAGTYDSGNQQQEAAPASTATTYESLLSRYISSLTQQKNDAAVLNLYKAQLAAHPDEQWLYENFAAYLAANRLLEDEASLYRHAIEQFKEKNWYEKLARWYLRNQRDTEFEQVSKEIVDTFSGTEVATYFQQVLPSYSDPYRALYLALNQYAHDRFPYNLTFVNNLLDFYDSAPIDMQSWEVLAVQYYAMDEGIRSRYLAYLSAKGTMVESVKPANSVETRFAGDILLWRSHYEEALPYYQDLSKQYSSDREINVLLADLTRSLAAYDRSKYDVAAGLREHLARIQPSDSALWTTAGETMADIESYDRAKAYWQNILQINKHDPDRYLEVATILWDYYLFDDALATLEQARAMEDDPELFAFEAGAIQEARRRYDLAIAEYSKSLLQDSESARRRLVQLYWRAKLAPVVRATLEQRLKENPQESGWWLGIAGFYAEVQERDTAHDLIRRAIETLNPKEFSIAVTSLMSTAQDLDFPDLQEQILQLQVSRAETDLDRIQLTLNLARFYEGREKQEPAEAAYRKLYTAMPRNVGIINETLSYYWRTRQYAKAYKVYDEILPVANAVYQRQYLLESARRHLSQKDYAPALAAAQQLSSGDPLNSEYFQLIAEIYAGRQDYAALSEHYKQGLTTIRGSALPEDEKKNQIASMRRGIVAADVILKDYTAALDQYIEILNRDAENSDLVNEVSAFALEHGVFDRLIETYAKTAAESPKDHRWPMMLGRLHFTAGNFDAAIGHFQAAIAIRPERTDLRRQLAESLQRLGRYDEAIAVYEKLYAMTYKDKMWLGSMAELHARLGHTAKAMELIRAEQDSSLSPMDLEFAVCGRALDLNMPAEAAKHGALAMQSYDADMSQSLDADGLAHYTEALIRSGGTLKAFSVLWQTYGAIKTAQNDATFDSEELRSSEYSVRDELIRGFPELLLKYATGDQLEALDLALAQPPLSTNFDWKKDLFVPMARAAGMAPAEERLLRELAEHAWKTPGNPEIRNYREQLRSFYVDRMEYGRCAEWLEEQWRLDPQSDLRHDLVDVAENYRLAGMNDKELIVLREYYRFGLRDTIQDQAVRRYIELLYEKKLNDELAQAADAGNFAAVNYFIEHRDQGLALRAADAVAKKKQPVWLSTQKAMIHREFRSPVSAAQTDYNAALDLRTIGEQLASAGNSERSVLGDSWFYYAAKYGEHLWWNGDKDGASAFLVSDLEGAPTNASRQEALGDFYFSEKDYTNALYHFTLSTQLQPDSPVFTDKTARALYALNRKDEALAVWKQMIASPSVPRYQLLVDSAVENGFVDLISNDVEKFIETSVEHSGDAGLGTLLPSYLNALPLNDSITLTQKWIGLAPDPMRLGDLLVNNDEVKPDLQRRAAQSVTAALKQKMLASAGNARTSYQRNYLSWATNYAGLALSAGDLQEAMNVTAEALPQAASDQDTRDTLVLNQSRALIRSRKKSEAMQVLRAYIEQRNEEQNEAVEVNPTVVSEERYRSASNLLESEGEKDAASDLLAEMFEKLIAAGRTEDANYTGLTRVKLKKNELAEAQSLLKRMIYNKFENLGGLETAAGLMEESNHLAEAIEYRQELAKRIRTDTKNLAQLSADLLKAGRKPEAAKMARGVLQSDSATVEDRVAAAQVYAKSAADQVGPLEMRELEQSARGSYANAGSASRPYFRNLRSVALKEMLTPNLELLRLQKFIAPQDKTLDVQLFEAFRTSGEFEAAMLVLDPERHGNEQEYTPQPASTTRYGAEDYDYGYYVSYPVEDLSLSEEKTRALSLEMADCAVKINQDAARIFYMRMALHHTTDEKQKTALQETIAGAEAQWDEKRAAAERRYKIGENIGRQS